MGMITRMHAPLRRVAFGFIAVAFVALALTGTPAGNETAMHKSMNKSLLTDSKVPVPVRAILERACQDCHSENTVWPWYSHIPPMSWQIHADVDRGRAFMDLTKWNDYTESDRRGFKALIGAATQNHVMPPPKYVWVHRNARLSSDELELIRAWALSK